jgi:hypothetical protein
MMQCPLCTGKGHLRRTEVLDRLGVKDFARVAQLSAEEAFRLLQQKHEHDDQNAWARFEAEVQRIRLGLEDKLRFEQSQNMELQRRVEDHLREMATLRQRNSELEAEMSKAARRGRLEERSFEDEARGWAGMTVDRLSRNGDFVLAFRDPSGAPLEPRLLVDNKDKAAISESDIRKLIRDAKERHIPISILVAKEEGQLRQIDRDYRWAEQGGVWLLRTTRGWLPRDLEVLKPVFERMRTEGADFLQRNSALSEEVCRTFVDLDEIEKQLKAAAKSIDAATTMTVKYRVRLRTLCDGASVQKKAGVAG